MMIFRFDSQLRINCIIMFIDVFRYIVFLFFLFLPDAVCYGITIFFIKHWIHILCLIYSSLTSIEVFIYDVINHFLLKRVTNAFYTSMYFNRECYERYFIVIKHRVTKIIITLGAKNIGDKTLQ